VSSGGPRLFCPYLLATSSKRAASTGPLGGGSAPVFAGSLSSSKNGAIAAGVTRRRNFAVGESKAVHDIPTDTYEQAWRCGDPLVPDDERHLPLDDVEALVLDLMRMQPRSHPTRPALLDKLVLAPGVLPERLKGDETAWRWICWW